MKLTLDLHDARKELPNTSCRVAFIQAEESDGKILFMGRLSYSVKHKCFNADDWDTDEEAANTAIGMRDGRSTYWSYLPESLKEKEGETVMREILFRGKRKDNGEWVEGFLIIRKIWSQTVYVIREEDNGFDAYVEYEVVPETVGQFTGLTDKNGKKIFELIENGD